MTHCPKGSMNFEGLQSLFYPHRVQCKRLICYLTSSSYPVIVLTNTTLVFSWTLTRCHFTAAWWSLVKNQMNRKGRGGIITIADCFQVISHSWSFLAPFASCLCYTPSMLFLDTKPVFSNHVPDVYTAAAAATAPMMFYVLVEQPFIKRMPVHHEFCFL